MFAGFVHVLTIAPVSQAGVVFWVCWPGCHAPEWWLVVCWAVWAVVPPWPVRPGLPVVMMFHLLDCLTDHEVEATDVRCGYPLVGVAVVWPGKLYLTSTERVVNDGPFVTLVSDFLAT